MTAEDIGRQDVIIIRSSGRTGVGFAALSEQPRWGQLADIDASFFF